MACKKGVIAVQMHKGPAMKVQFRNIRIKAGTNPVFGDVRIEGVMYVEAPNYVQFGNNVKVVGVIVTENPGEGASLDTHKIEFVNGLTLFGVDCLPDDPEFSVLRHMTGAAILAQGFALEFKNNFTSVGGVIAARTSRGHEGGQLGTIVARLVRFPEHPQVDVAIDDGDVLETREI